MNRTFSAFCALLAFAASASAEIIGVETFDYPDGAIANQNGGTFWDFNNVAPGHTGTASNWDNVSNAPTVAGSQLITDNSRAKREYNGANEGQGAVNDANVNKAVYYRVTVTTGALPLPDFFGLSSYDLTNERIFIGKRFGQANFGVEISGGASNNSAIAVQANTTYTIVARIDYAANANTIRLYVNPDLNAGEPATPSTSVSFPNTEWSTAVRLASGNTGSAVTWDNLVVATTWDDLGTVVTTAVDEDNVSLDPAAGGGTGVSLREAVIYSPSGTLITFIPAADGHTIILTIGQITVPGAISIDASSLPRGLTLDANDSSRHFNIAAGTSLSASGLTFTRGAAPFGSSIFNNGTVRLSRCTLTDNLASGSATILQQAETSISRFDHCTLSDNRATGAGGSGGVGGLQIIGGNSRLASCTISGNTGTGVGGGLLLNGSATAVQIERCIIAGNIDPGFPDIGRAGGTLTAIGPSVIGNNFSVESTFPAGGTLVGSPTTPLNPRLSPLGFFGGPMMTMHPLVNSPAIDAGSTTDPGGADQRGFPRFVDGDGNGTPAVDLGAVEAGLRGPDAFNPIFPVTTAVDEDDGTIGQGSGAGTSLREAIKYLPNGAVVSFINALTGATIHLDLGELAVPAGKTLFIDGSSPFRPITISGKNASRVFSIPAGATVAMQRLILTEGKAPQATAPPNDGNGGAIRSQGTLSLLACTLSENVSGTGESFADTAPLYNSGGAVYSSGRALVSGCTLSGNRCADFDETGAFAGVGGAILNDATGRLTVVNSTLNGNAAGTGWIGGAAGAIYNRGIAAVSATTLSGNSGGHGTGFPSGGAGRGGAIFNDEGTLRVTSCTLNGNTAGFSVGNGGTGGAIYNKGTLTVANSTLTNNACGFGALGMGGSGGAIFGENTPLTVYHCTITGNFAGQGGSSNGIGGGIFQPGAFSLNGSIVTKNFLRLETSGETFENNLAGSAPSGSGNLTSGDPMLAPLSDYGSPTFTMLPLPGSPALDAATGSIAAIDQRGLARTGSRDIGAVEVQPALVGFVDTDSDGMDDRLEPLYGFVVGVQDGQLDRDGDGSSNATELGAMTGPRDPARSFKILSYTKSGNAISLSWTSFPGLSYSLDYGDTFSFGGTVGLGIASGMTFSNTIGPFDGAKTFFRIRRD